MKLKRKKVGDRNYDLVDTETGEVVANCVQTGEHGRDNYPWDWSLSDGRIFGRLGATTGTSSESLKAAVEYIQDLGTAYGFLKPVGQVSGLDVKEGQVFRHMVHNTNYFYRALADAHGDGKAYLDVNNQKGDTALLIVPEGDTVTVYA